MVEAGQNPRFAEMCALQAPPGTQGTDRAFMEGRMNNQQLNDMPLRQAKYVAEEAKAAGINISGKYYCGGLADTRKWKDPEAWVSSTDDVLRVAKARQLQVQGMVNYDPGTAPPQRVALNERIIKEEMARLAPNSTAKPQELREQVIKKHAHPKLRGK
jgi:hypothetical protein